MNLDTLKTEITTDPANLQYAGKSDQQIADLLNLSRPTITITRDWITSAELWDAIDPAEWSALTATEQQRITTIMSLGQVHISNGNTRGHLRASFPAGKKTDTAIGQLTVRQGSRAEQLFGWGATVSADDIRRAMGRGA